MSKSYSLLTVFASIRQFQNPAGEPCVENHRDGSVGLASPVAEISFAAQLPDWNIFSQTFVQQSACCIACRVCGDQDKSGFVSSDSLFRCFRTCLHLAGPDCKSQYAPDCQQRINACICLQ
jgi:hypothetical protein